jgi:two-component sensor histidine kinase/PAS domain-containing protein
MDQISQTFFLLVSFLSILAGYKYFQYRTPITRWGGLFLFCLAIELSCFSNQMGVDNQLLSPLCFTLQVISYYFLTLFWLLFISEIIGLGKRANLLTIMPILSIPAIIQVFLMIKWVLDPVKIQSIIEFNGSLSLLPQILGGYGLFILMAIYGMRILSIIFLTFFTLKANSYHKNLIVLMLFGTIIVLLMDILDWSGFYLIPSVQMTQLGLASMGVVLFFVTVVWRFGGILPISRESVFEEMHDGVIILDYYDKVIDLNNPARKIIGVLNKKVINRNLIDIWPFGARLIAEHPNESWIENECEFSIEGQKRTFDINISLSIGINNTSTGRLIILRNITRPELMEEALNERSQELQRTNALMSTLALVTANLQPAIDSSKINEKVGVELKKMGLVYFIAQLDPETGELVITYLSVLPEVIKWIEKLIRYKIFGFRLDKVQFSGLYKKLESREISFSRYDPANTGSGYRKIPMKALSQAIQLVGLKPENPALVLPLVTRDHALGVIGVWGSDIRESDIPAFQIFASQMAHLMETALFQEAETQRSNELIRSNNLVVALSKVTSALGSTSNTDLVLDILGKELNKVGLDCAVVSVDSAFESASIKYISARQEVIHKFEKLTGIKLQSYQIPNRLWPEERIIQEQIPVWYPDVTNIIRQVFPIISETLGRSVAKLLFKGVETQLYILPLTSGDQTVGAMAIWGPDLRVSDAPILSVFSSQVAGIFQNMTNYENEVQRTLELSHSNAMLMALSNVASHLDTANDLTDVFINLGKELKKIGIKCMIGTLDDAKQNLMVEHLSIMPELVGWSKKMGHLWQKEIIVPRHLWPTQKVTDEKKPFWDPDPISNISRIFPSLPKQIFEKAFEMADMNLEDHVCYLPVINEEDVIGIFAVWGGNLHREDIHGLSVFTNQLATAIKNTRLYNQAQKEIAERTLAEEKIREALSEKEILLKEVHHRVKNNLQVISSLLNLQAAEVSDDETIKALMESQNRVRSMALIHEKLYQSNDLARIDFAGYLESLISSLSQTYRIDSDKIRLKVNAENIGLNIDTAIPCGLIVNELVSNSLKYAFPSGKPGTIEVSCKQSKNNRCTLLVSDNGIGLPIRFEIDKSPSLGLKLVTSLVKQIGGSLVVDRKNGTQIKIEFIVS